MSKLQSLGEPIARITAIHSSTAAAKSDDAGGLYSEVFLSVAAKVKVGLCNGAAGISIQDPLSGRPTTTSPPHCSVG